MDKRAHEILEKIRKENKHLYIFLSGGVDSTAVTIAIIKAADNDFHNIHIVCNEGTINENKDFVELLKTYPIDIYFHDEDLDILQEKILKTDYTLTGWCADQLFGSIINQLYPDWYFKDWHSWFKTYKNIENIDDAIQQFETAFKFYNLPIKTLGEFLWFMNFSTKYNIVKYSDVLYSGNITDRMISFYDTVEFNNWSVSNFDILHRYNQQDTKHYKIELKKYIYNFNHDKNYLQNKGKLGSWNYSYMLKKSWRTIPHICIMEDETNCFYYKYYDKEYEIHKSLDVTNILYRNYLKFYRNTNCSSF